MNSLQFAMQWEIGDVVKQIENTAQGKEKLPWTHLKMWPTVCDTWDYLETSACESMCNKTVPSQQ